MTREDELKKDTFPLSLDERGRGEGKEYSMSREEILKKKNGRNVLRWTNPAYRKPWNNIRNSDLMSSLSLSIPGLKNAPVASQTLHSAIVTRPFTPALRKYSKGHSDQRDLPGPGHPIRSGNISQPYPRKRSFLPLKKYCKPDPTVDLDLVLLPALKFS